MARVRGKLVWYSYIPREIIKLGKQGLIEAGLEIYNDSQEIVPKDDHQLTLGAKVSSEETKQEMTVVISYGNNSISAEYAVIQHYNLQYNHANGEQALYLQNPFLKHEKNIPNKVADRIRDLL